MKIQNKNNHICFNAKMMLNNKKIIANTPFASETTALDTMFNENIIIRKLNNFSVNSTKKLLASIFTKKASIPKQIIHKFKYKTILLSRIIADRIFLLANRKKIEELNKEFSSIDTNSKEYIEELAKLGQSLEKKYILTNSEDKELEKITSTNEASLFILNHPNHHKDKFVYAIISSLLSKMYVSKGVQENCPRPKILVSKNMLKIIHAKIANIYKKLGLTTIDANIDSSRKSKISNAFAIKNLLYEFTENKSNIFIFPEGNNSLRTDKTLKERIQPGISNIIKQASSLKQQVRVVPIGIDYSKSNKNNLGSIHIGTPLYFYKNGEKIYVSKDNNKTNAISIEQENATSEIQEIICNNLEFVVNKAKQLKA